MKPAVIITIFAGVVLAAAWGCSSPGAEEGEPALAEPLPTDGSLPLSVQELVFGGRRGCRADRECGSLQCVYGSCIGLLIADETWRQRDVAAKLAARAKADPELERRVTTALTRLLARDDTDQSFRGRAVRGLEALGAREVLRGALDAAPGAVHEDLSLALLRMGDPVGLDVVLQLVESERASLQLEALYALGDVRGADPTARVLPVLLSFLTGDLGQEPPRAALDALGRLGDPRAIRPLVTFVATGPEALADRASAVLAKLTRADLGPRALAWEAWVEKNNPPPAPPFTLRTHSSEEDIGLPPP